MNNIQIAILGPVSAGKSTLLNGICCDTMSEMAKKRTTMLPQKYIINNNINYMNSKNAKEIYDENVKRNKEIFELR